VRSADTRTAAVIIALASLPACSSTAFTPAPLPANICSLLPLADVQTIFPTARDGYGGSPVMTLPDVWTAQCDWNAAGGIVADVSLVLQGALTPRAIADLDVGYETVDPGGAPKMEVSGVGDRAFYVDDSGTAQILQARTGRYLVNVAAAYFTSDVTEAQLKPLIQKVISRL
jgi:hypothetical protein